MSSEEIKSSPQADARDTQSEDTQSEDKDFSQTEVKQEGKPKETSDVKQESKNQETKDLNEQILEKLDIKQKPNNQEPQEKPKTLEQNPIEAKIKQGIQQDFDKIQKLIQSGLINSVQGQNLKKQVLKKAFDKLVQTEKIKRDLDALMPQNQNKAAKPAKNQIFDEFAKNNPNFFNSSGRAEVLNYLKSSDVNLGQGELSRISELVRNIEKSAIERYLQEISHEKNLQESNEAAKQKLTANAQQSSGSKTLSRTFTREQIGKMSPAEFSKYEKAIMNQLKKGQIK